MMQRTTFLWYKVCQFDVSFLVGMTVDVSLYTTLEAMPQFLAGMTVDNDTILLLFWRQ